jgi:methionyl-tRNA formyltransferase
MRVLFIGTGDIGLPSLEWLLNTTKHEVVGVVTQPDKPVGRKQVLTPPQIKVSALAAGKQVIQPPKIRHAVEELKAFNADVAIVVAYGQILSRAVLDVPKFGCLNVHTSLLAASSRCRADPGRDSRWRC